MKKFKLLLFLTLTLSNISVLFSQSSLWERSMPVYHSGAAYSVIDLPDSGWLCFMHSDYDNGGTAYVEKFDKYGNFLFGKLAIIGTYFSNSIKDNSGGIYISAPNRYQCDVPGSHGSFIGKLDSNSNLNWYNVSKNYQTSKLFVDPIPKIGMGFNRTNNLKVLINDSFYTFNSQIGKLFSQFTVDSNTGAFALNTNDEIIISTKSGIIRLDSSGKKLGFSPSPVLFNFKNDGNKGFIGNSINKLFKVDSTYSIIDSFDFSSRYKNINQILVSGSFIYTLSREVNDSFDIISKFDDSLHLIWENKMANYFHFNSLAFNGKYLCLAGDNRGTPFIKTMDINKNTNLSKNDAGIERIILGKISTIMAHGYVYIYNVDLDVVIKNFGNTTIDSITITTDESFDQIGCNFFTDPMKTIHDVALSAGDTLTVHLGTYELGINPTKVNICARTTAPNGVSDYNPANDKQCLIYTGLENLTDFVDPCIIYPNPFQSSTNISYSLTKPENVKLEVFDMLGRRVALLANDRQTEGEHTQQFQSAENRAGVYILKITIGERFLKKQLTIVR